MCSKQSALLINRFVNPIQTTYRPVTGYVHPVTGKTPPTLDEFDPLNPGEWQLGAAGKILPRLPEGTRCGKLVMGKYGLYNPRVRKLQEECFPKHEAGVPTEIMTKNHVISFKICVWITVFSFIVGFHNMQMMLYGTKEKPLWPYSLFMSKSDNA